MESLHGRLASCFCSIVDEGTIALRNQEKTFNISRRLAREVVLEVNDSRPGW
jgi:hypothetical protein